MGTRNELATTPEQEQPVASTPGTGRTYRWLWIVVAFVIGLLIGAVVVWQVADDGEPSDVAEVSSEVEQEIAELVDAWQAAWRDVDGGAALALFTADGRYVGYLTDERQDGRGEYLEGWSGEELRAGIERHPRGWQDIYYVDLLIVPGTSDQYQVAYFAKNNEADTIGQLGLLNVVDEDGTLKIRYAETWSSMGWHRIADGLPYQPVGAGR
jgi:hypothetical protein